MGEGWLAEVVLLQIRGVGGATAEEILEGPVTQTSGDELAGFYRADEPKTTTPTEAYEWGRLTSGSRTSALWWILFPFTLVNVAGWMFRPTADEAARDDEPQRTALWYSRLIVVGGALAITAAYVMWTVALTTEMVAFGCGLDADCAGRWYMGPLSLFGEQNQIWLVTCGIGLAAIILLGLFLFILRTQDKLEGYETDATRRLLGVVDSKRTSRLRRNTQLEDQAFWYKWAEHRRLFRWHLALTMVLLGAGAGHAIERVGWQAPQGNAWWAILAVLAAIVLMVWSLTRPERFREAAAVGDTGGSDLSKRVGWTLTHLGLALAGSLVGALLTDWIQDGEIPEFGYLWAVRALSVVLYIVAILMVGALAIRRRRQQSKLSWSMALMPGFAAALAVIITGTGFAAIANLVGRLLLGADWVDDRGFNIVIVDLFALSLIITLVAVAVVIYRAAKPQAAVTQTYFGTASYADLSDREQTWVDSVAQARLIAGMPQRADRILAALTVIMVVMTIAQAAFGDFSFAAGPDGSFASPLFGIEGLSFFHTAAATATVLYLFPGIQLIRATSKSRDSRRQIGKVWDVLSFWPRRFHPLAAPCYAERAVPEFRNRIREHLAAGRGVVVSAHSQGTVIAFAALVQIAAEDEEVKVDIPEMPEVARGKSYSELDAVVQRTMYPSKYETTPAPPPRPVIDKGPLGCVGLVTFGSPLSALYGPLFPWHFGTPGRFAGLRDDLAELPKDEGPAWRSLWRPTDYIGQKVFIAPGGILDPPDDRADICVRESLQPLFPPESHSDYEREEQLRTTVALFVTGIGSQP